MEKEAKLELKELQELNLISILIKNKENELILLNLGKQKRFELIAKKYNLDAEKDYILQEDKLILKEK